jgi:hypothetical protein
VGLRRVILKFKGREYLIVELYLSFNVIISKNFFVKMSLYAKSFPTIAIIEP